MAWHFFSVILLELRFRMEYNRSTPCIHSKRKGKHNNNDVSGLGLRYLKPEQNHSLFVCCCFRVGVKVRLATRTITVYANFNKANHVALITTLRHQ